MVVGFCLLWTCTTRPSAILWLVMVFKVQPGAFGMVSLDPLPNDLFSWRLEGSRSHGAMSVAEMREPLFIKRERDGQLGLERNGRARTRKTTLGKQPSSRRSKRKAIPAVRRDEK